MVSSLTGKESMDFKQLFSLLDLRIGNKDKVRFALAHHVSVAKDACHKTPIAERVIW